MPIIDCKLFSVVFPSSSKVLVITGTTDARPLGSANPEIVDLERPTASCSQPLDLPASLHAAIGGTFDENSTFVCFGTVAIFS